MKEVFRGKIQDAKLVFEDKPGFLKALSKYANGLFELRLSTWKQRTRRQNGALHLFFQQLAESLNNAGLDQKKVLKPEVSIDWSMEDVKEKLWRPFQIAIIRKESTTDLESIGDIEKIHKTLMRELGEKHGVEFIPFPFECKECKGLSRHYEGCSQYHY